MSGIAAARLQDVARLAGVHVSTVSRVLNGDVGRISEETRDRVTSAAKQLNYRPNLIARGLKMSSTGALGLLVPSLRNPVFSEFIRGAFHRAFERDFVVLLAEDQGDAASQAAYERLVESGRIDGLLIASGNFENTLVDRLVEQRVPHVFVNRRRPGSRRNVYMDEETPGRIAAQHLLDLGHTRLAHLAGPSSLDTAQRRTNGFMSVVGAEGIVPFVVRSNYEEGDAFRAMQDIVDQSPMPTAVFVSNINQAIGSLAALRTRRVRAPRDISLICCDEDPLVEFLEVPLTTIRMPLWELGVAAVDSLLSQINGEAPSDVLVASEPSLILRSSTSRHVPD